MVYNLATQSSIILLRCRFYSLNAAKETMVNTRGKHIILINKGGCHWVASVCVKAFMSEACGAKVFGSFTATSVASKPLFVTWRIHVDGRFSATCSRNRRTLRTKQCRKLLKNVPSVWIVACW